MPQDNQAPAFATEPGDTPAMIHLGRVLDAVEEAAIGIGDLEAGDAERDIMADAWERLAHAGAVNPEAVCLAMRRQAQHFREQRDEDDEYDEGEEE